MSLLSHLPDNDADILMWAGFGATMIVIGKELGTHLLDAGQATPPAKRVNARKNLRIYGIAAVVVIAVFGVMNLF